jgi:hypothetical protein
MITAVQKRASPAKRIVAGILREALLDCGNSFAALGTDARMTLGTRIQNRSSRPKAVNDHRSPRAGCAREMLVPFFPQKSSQT